MSDPNKETAQAPSKDRLRLWLQLLKLNRVIENRVRENLRNEFGTTLPRFDVMAALYRYKDGLKMSELSKVLKVSNGNVTGIVERLVKKGHVVRISVDGDRRVQLVCLTEDGRKEFEHRAKAHESWIDEVFESFSAAEAVELNDRLDELLKTVIDDDAD